MTDLATTGPSSMWKPWTWKLHWQILLGLLCGVLGGWILATYVQSTATENAPAAKLLPENPLWQLSQTIGDMFLAALKMIVIPLVLSSIILSIASIAGRSGFARMGFRTLAFYASTGLVAILLGILMVNVIRPGVSSNGKPLLQMEGLESFSSSFWLIS